MDFKDFLEVLERHGLRLASMGESIKSALVDEGSGKAQRVKWVPHNYKEAHIISWNTEDVDNMRHIFSMVEDKEWEDLFSQVKEQLDGKEEQIAEGDEIR